MQVSSISVEDISKLKSFESDRKAFASEKSEFEKTRNNELKQIEKDKLKNIEKDQLLKEKDERISRLIEELKFKDSKIEELNCKLSNSL